MLLRDLFEIISGEIEIYIEDSTHYIYRGYNYAIPEELLDYKITNISGSLYYPYMTHSETVNCLCIELAKENKYG